MYNEHLKAPLGITSDSDGNLYVVGFQSNNVFLFSKDGQTCKELIPASDKISNPNILLLKVHIESGGPLTLISLAMLKLVKSITCMIDDSSYITRI
jgi:hypothetical protein